MSPTPEDDERQTIAQALGLSPDKLDAYIKIFEKMGNKND